MASDGARVDGIPRIHATTRPVLEEHCSLRKDIVAMPSRSEVKYYLLERAPAVIIVPVTSEGDVVLIRQYRIPVQEWCLETPDGGSHDAGSDSLEEVAMKELREEVGGEAGGEAGELERLGSVYSSPAFANEHCDVFIAWDTKLSRAPEREETEAIETICLPVEEALRRARAGEMKSGPCILALLWAEPKLRGRKYEV